MTMRLFALAAIGVTTFAATMTFETSNANAVVYCVEGVYRAGCVVRPGVAPVRGVARRTTRRVVRRRSDMTLKHDISLLGHLDNGLGFYRSFWARSYFDRFTPMNGRAGPRLARPSRAISGLMHRR